MNASTLHNFLRKVTHVVMTLAIAYAPVVAASGGSGGGGNSGSGGGGNSGSGSSGSGSSGSGSWGTGSWGDDRSGSGSGSWGSSNSGSGSGDVYRGSGDYSGSGSSNSGSGSSNSGSGSSNSGSGSSNSGSGSSNTGSGSSNSGSGSSNSGSGSSNSGSGGYSYDDGRSWQTLAARERPDFDRNGFPTRRGEIISLDLSKDQIKSAKARGFSVIDKVKLSALGLEMVRLRVPRGMTSTQAINMLRMEDAATFYELDHFFGVTTGDVVGKAGADMVDMKIANPKPFTVGMIDTAVWRQATLQSARVDAQDFANRSGKPPFAHGTAVASILHRQGATRILSANVFTADGRPYSSAEAIARAMNWMVARKVPVINISIAGPRNALVDRVIATATTRGHTIVAAAGNGGPNAPAAYPAASPGAVAVTAIDKTGHVYLNANRGAYIDMAAIGVGVGAEAPDGYLRPHSGTSFAAPFVTAWLARCQPTIDPNRRQACEKQMETRARDLGKPGRDPVYGHGMLVP